ncbi:MAG: cytochrome c biogenesis protein CcsA [Methylococcales bacterium]|nr:cytochrome c biogenesis protein CcsA [Methylococcales bacterium]
MYTFPVGIIAVLSYVAAFLLLLKELVTPGRLNRIPATYPAWTGGCLHAVYLFLMFQQHEDFNFSFFNAAALVALFIVLILLFAALDKPVEKLGVAIFPLAAILLVLDMYFPEKSHPLVAHNWQMSVHILSSIIAFSLLNIAALQAILLAIQEQQLRRHQPRRLMLVLPPLQAMEILLFQMIAVGLFFLTVSLLSGFIFIEDLFAQHLVHKTVLSIIAWLIFSALLTGRLRYGWRGSVAIHWTLAGFLLLLLAYFGSKLVLELILKKV